VGLEGLGRDLVLKHLDTWKRCVDITPALNVVGGVRMLGEKSEMDKFMERSDVVKYSRLLIDRFVDLIIVSNISTACWLENKVVDFYRFLFEKMINCIWII